MPTVAEDRIDRYELLTELGRGATGVVYKARDPELDRIVAIKTLRPARELPAEECGPLQRRLRREAATVARLSHPNIVAIHDVVVWHDTPCVVMEYVEGRTLAHLIAGGPLMPARAIHIVLQMCDALECAHALGVVHRDIKPGNILIGEKGLAKLGDFGLAPLAGPGGEGAGAIVGTPGYIAPEQVTQGVTDARSDVFSLGVVLYEAVSGVRAFPGTDLVSVLSDVAHVEPASPREYNAAVTPALAAVIQQAMSKRPDRRYQSASAFARALARVRDSEGEGTGVGAVRTVRRALAAGLVGLAVAGSTGDPPATWRSTGSPARRSAETGPVTTEPSVRRRPPGPSEVRRAGEVSAGRVEVSPAIPRPERTGQRSVVSATPEVRQTVRRTEPSVSPPRPAETVGTAPGSPQRQGCLSVNAVPFATVLVDGQPLGETPAACLRVNVGEHRIQLQQDGERSPERLVRVGEQHTAENPVRLSYDFRSQQFGH